MKAVFAHDHIFYHTDSKNFYTNGKFPYSVWARYLQFFDELIIIGRGKQFNNEKGVVASGGPNVSFVKVPNISSIVGKIHEVHLAKRIIESQLKTADALIARLPSEVGILSIKVAMKLNKPWAVELVGCPLNAYWYHGKLLGKFYAPLVFIKTRNLIKKSKFAIYVTESYLQKRYPSTGVTANASNVEIDPVPENVLIDKLRSLQNKKNNFKIGLIGGISTKLKGIDSAIDAIKIALQKHHYVLEIVGDGNSEIWKRKILKNNLNDHVVFKGTLKRGRDLASWLDSLDIYIQPSLTEGLPRALIEAMSRGCPAIASNVGGIPELLDRTFLHKPKDHKQLAKLILLLSENNKEAKKQAERNFNVAKNYYKDSLDRKRNEFWKAFYEYSKLKKLKGLE